MKTLIVSATRNTSKYKVDLSKSLKSLDLNNTDVIIHTDNKQSLPIVYNNYMCKEYYDKYQCILFVHDDVYVDDTKVFNKIKTQFNKGYSVVGLAGSSTVDIKEPALWHIMSDKKSWSGAVAHPFTNDSNQLYVTSFGPTPKRCIMLDGLFLAVNTKLLRKTDIKFDMQFDFHHYDIDFCLQCNENKLKLTTAPINVIHDSPGLLSIDDPVFQRSQKRFINKYAKIRS